MNFIMYGCGQDRWVEHMCECRCLWSLEEGIKHPLELKLQGLPNVGPRIELRFSVRAVRLLNL